MNERVGTSLAGKQRRSPGAYRRRCRQAAANLSNRKLDHYVPLNMGESDRAEHSMVESLWEAGQPRFPLL